MFFAKGLILNLNLNLILRCDRATFGLNKRADKVLIDSIKKNYGENTKKIYMIVENGHSQTSLMK